MKNDANVPFALVVGATSRIGGAIARELAPTHRLLLAGRDEEELARTAQDIRLRCEATVATVRYEAVGAETTDAFWERCLTLTQGNVAGAVLCQGDLGDEALALRSADEVERLIVANFVAPARLLTLIAVHLETAGRGFLVAIGSVAGDRGRQSNYPYGAAKAGLHTFLAGLRNRLWHSGVHVLTVKPGFVDTSMTWGRPGLFLVASPERVGRDVVRAITRRRNVLYTPWFWRGILGVLTSIPETIFKRLKL